MRQRQQLTIGEVAARAQLRTSAIRYYESVGLLPVPERVHGHRRYHPGIIQRLALLRFAQRAGFTIAEIRTLFHGFDADVPPAARWRTLAGRKLADLDALIANAQRMREILAEGMHCGCLRIEDCVIDGDAGCSLQAPGAGPTLVTLGQPRPRRARARARSRKWG